jgi:riboflavin synthase
MFTGIVEELGAVRAVEPQATGARFTFGATTVLEDARIGDSIAVNGCCLTIVDRGPDWWTCDAVAETLRRTALGALRVGDPVNLERSVRLADRLGGHLVQGHVDGQGRVGACTAGADGARVVSITAPPAVLRYVVEKGSIAVDGVSLTIVEVTDSQFTVALIPHTLQVTTLGRREPGDAVNLEVDVLAKYVERLLGQASTAAAVG